MDCSASGRLVKKASGTTALPANELELGLSADVKTQLFENGMKVVEAGRSLVRGLERTVYIALD